MLTATATKLDAASFVAYFVHLLRGLPKHHRSALALTTVNANPNLNPNAKQLCPNSNQLCRNTYPTPNPIPDSPVLQSTALSH